LQPTVEDVVVPGRSRQQRWPLSPHATQMYGVALPAAFSMQRPPGAAQRGLTRRPSSSVEQQACPSPPHEVEPFVQRAAAASHVGSLAVSVEVAQVAPALMQRGGDPSPR